MQLTSLGFLLFVLLGLILYYAFPKRMTKRGIQRATCLERLLTNIQRCLEGYLINIKMEKVLMIILNRNKSYFLMGMI